MTSESDGSEHVGEAEMLSLTCLLALERLLPVERAAFLLHRVFGRSPAETARTIGVSDAGYRRMFGRAHRVMTAAKPMLDAERTKRRELGGRFFAALHARDEPALAGLLAPDAVAYLSAHQPPALGARRVAELLGAISPDLAVEQLAISIEVRGGLVQTVRASCCAGTPGRG